MHDKGAAEEEIWRLLAWGHSSFLKNNIQCFLIDEDFSTEIHLNLQKIEKKAPKALWARYSCQCQISIE